MNSKTFFQLILKVNRIPYQFTYIRTASLIDTNIIFNFLCYKYNELIGFRVFFSIMLFFFA